MKKIYFLSTILCLFFTVWGQNNVGIGTASPNSSALLELTANDKGLLVPRMTTAQRLAIPTSPAQEALLVYDLNDKLFYFWDAAQWIGFPLPSYNQSLSFSTATQLLSLTDGGGTLTANLPMFNTALNFNALTQDLTVTDAGGSFTANLPMFNTALNFNLATQDLTVTDAGGSFIANLPMFNTALNFNAATQDLTVTDAGGTITANLPMFNTALNFNAVTQDLTVTDAGSSFTANLPMFNTALNFNNATQTLSITDAGGTLTTPLQVNNISLNFDSLTNQLSITDGGGTLTTLMNLNIDDHDWTRTPAINSMYPSNMGDRIGVGTNTPDPNALLELNSTSQGFLTTRMNTAQRLAIAAPPIGLEVFDITAGVKMFFNGTRWLEIGAVPIGSIQAWHKSLVTTPPLPWGWVECDGALIADPESPYNGTNAPDLNISERFLRGNAISGNLQTDDFLSHNHTGTTSADGDHNHGIDPPNTGSSIAGNHNHTGTTSTVTNFNSAMWIPFDDNLADNCESDWSDDNATTCGVGWNGKNTSGNFMGQLNDPCLDHNHSISFDGDHSHTTDIAPFTSTNSGIHQHTITTANTGGVETRPVNMSVVWIMRVK